VATNQFVRVARVDDVSLAGCRVVNAGGRTLALFADDDRIVALDNRCPHMGFPLDRGTVKNGILTCHWHHARFDLASGGTFDLFADDVPTFPVEIRDGEVWVDLSVQRDPLAHHRRRLEEGMQRNISLVIAKAVIGLLASGASAVDPFRIGLQFGTTYRRAGWGLSSHRGAWQARYSRVRR